MGYLVSSRLNGNGGNESFLRQAKTLYGFHIAQYFEKHGYFVAPLDTDDQEYLEGMKIDFDINGSPYEIKMPFEHNFANAAIRGGHAYSERFEDNILRKIADKKFMQSLVDLGVNRLYLNHDPYPALNSSRSDRVELYLGFQYIADNTIEKMCEDLKTPKLY